MIQFKDNARTDRRTEGQTDRPYLIGPIQLLPGVQKMFKTKSKKLRKKTGARSTGFCMEY